MRSLSRTSNMQTALALTIVCTLLVSGLLCAPSSSSQQQSTPAATISASSTSSHQSNGNSQSVAAKQSAATSSAAPADKPKPTSGQFSSAASTVNGSPSIVNLRPSSVADEAAIQRSQAEETNGAAFDGKNPFADDSLWQIPINLVRDLSANPDENQKDDIMAKSSNFELSNADEDDQDDHDVAPQATGSAPANANNPLLSSSSHPTIISASTTDLKTAAGYHYPSSHEHYGGHAAAGHHHGGHYGGAGDHYGGKYFQYASVPYPGSWEFGYRRGNPYHTIERYEHGKGPHFKTKVKWSDKHGGYGVHVWDYNHDDHHSHHYGGHHDSYAPSHYGSGHYGGHQEGHYGHH